MFTIYAIVIVLIGIIALVGTLIAGRQVNQTIDSLEGVKPEEEEAHLRDHHFTNEKRNLGVLTWIYAITFIVAILAVAIYMIFFR